MAWRAVARAHAAARSSAVRSPAGDRSAVAAYPYPPSAYTVAITPASVVSARGSDTSLRTVYDSQVSWTKRSDQKSAATSRRGRGPSKGMGTAGNGRRIAMAGVDPAGQRVSPRPPLVKLGNPRLSHCRQPPPATASRQPTTPSDLVVDAVVQSAVTCVDPASRSSASPVTRHTRQSPSTVAPRL